MVSRLQETDRINSVAAVSALPHSIRWWGMYQEDVSKKEAPCSRSPLAHIYIFEIIVSIFEIIVGGLL